MQINGLAEFLEEHPLMSLLPIEEDGDTVLQGKVKIFHKYKQHPEIQRFIELKIVIPKQYPYRSPSFEEIGGFVPRTNDLHVNPDGSLCLGSPYRLNRFLRESSNFNQYFNIFFIPYIYAISLKLQHNIDFVFGELKHGIEGELEDLFSVFEIDDKDQIKGFLIALSVKKRVANKKPCPCQCGNRLGVCKTHYMINTQRYILPRSWYKNMKQRLVAL